MKNRLQAIIFTTHPLYVLLHGHGIQIQTHNLKLHQIKKYYKPLLLTAIMLMNYFWKIWYKVLDKLVCYILFAIILYFWTKL
jgi:hypothetical protein